MNPRDLEIQHTESKIKMYRTFTRNSRYNLAFQILIFISLSALNYNNPNAITLVCLGSIATNILFFLVNFSVEREDLRNEKMRLRFLTASNDMDAFKNYVVGK